MTFSQYQKSLIKDSLSFGNVDLSDFYDLLTNALNIIKEDIDLKTGELFSISEKSLKMNSSFGYVHKSDFYDLSTNTLKIIKKDIDLKTLDLFTISKKS